MTITQAMNYIRTYNCLFATVLIAVYMFLPVSNFASAATLELDGSSCQVVSSLATTAPCDTCPCSDSHGSDCCDTTFCSCSCHAPLSHGLLLSYAPEMSIECFLEPSWSLLQVYRSIFVPPQNFA
ncbi:MAG TPA: hypothetical protein HPP97_04970 [Desulfuromonadales bacterium]|nr:hypothetical protein [Desulfuromonadales bacterium]